MAAEVTVRQAVAMAGRAAPSSSWASVIVGVPTGDVSVPLPSAQDHQVRLPGGATYLPADDAEPISLLQRGAVRVDELVTSVRPRQAVAGAFEPSVSGEQVKVLLAIDPAVR